MIKTIKREVEEEVRVCDYCDKEIGDKEIGGDDYLRLCRKEGEGFAEFELCRKHSDEAIKLLEAWIKKGKPKEIATWRHTDRLIFDVIRTTAGIEVQLNDANDTVVDVNTENGFVYVSDSGNVRHAFPF